MKIKGFLKHNYAVAGVIEALLLIALVAVIISLIQLNYIPLIMKDKEAAHMDEVANQFSTIKSVIEIQSTMGILNQINEGDPKYTASPISSPITLGSEQLPYFVTVAATGQVTLVDEVDTGNYKIIILSNSGFYEIPLTCIKYEPSNNYFFDQNYIFEGGGIILNQYNGEVMKVTPAMNVDYNELSDKVEITYNIPLFVGVPGKKICSGGGYGPPKTCFVRTNYIEYEEYEGLLESTSNYINISTAYSDAWGNGLINSTKGLLWEYYDNDYIDVIIDKTTTPNIVSITPKEKGIDLKIIKIEIGVQIGAGVVVST